MSKQILIGVDIGTSNIKAVATDTSLKILAEYSEVTPFTHEKNFSEIDARKLAQTVISVASKAAQDAGGVVAAIAFTGFSETGFLLDDAGNPLAPGLAWHDPRGFRGPKPRGKPPPNAPAGCGWCAGRRGGGPDPPAASPSAGRAHPPGRAATIRPMPCGGGDRPSAPSRESASP